MDIETPTRLAEIRRLNDQFRTTFRGGPNPPYVKRAELPDRKIVPCMLPSSLHMAAILRIPIVRANAVTPDVTLMGSTDHGKVG
jgi:hypothetical protein